MLTATLISAAGLIGFGLFTDRRADLREAAVEARFPPVGEMVKVDGHDVHVIVEGAGPDLVLIHGAGGNARDFHRLIDALKPRFRVYAVDRPGLGWTSAITGATPRGQARLLANAVRELGADKPMILGHSYGAAVAMAWALEDETSALVIVSGATMPWPGALQRFYRVFGSHLGGLLGAPLVSAYLPDKRFQASVEGVFAPQEMPVGYINHAAVPLATRIRSFRESAAQVKRLRPQVLEMSAHYTGVTVPAEILHGTADTTVRPEIHAVPLSELLPGANLTLLEGIGHAPHHVAEATVIEAIDRAARRAGLR